MGDEAAEGEDDEEDVGLDFPHFMEVVLQLRGCNSATVKDIVDLRKFIQNALDHRTEIILDALGKMQRSMSQQSPKKAPSDLVTPQPSLPPSEPISTNGTICHDAANCIRVPSLRGSRVSAKQLE